MLCIESPRSTAPRSGVHKFRCKDSNKFAYLQKKVYLCAKFYDYGRNTASLDNGD